MVDPDYSRLNNMVAARIRHEIGSLSKAAAMKSDFNNVYHLADANLMHFLPHLDKVQRQEIIAEVFHQQRMAVSDYENHDLLKNTKIEGFDETHRSRAHIYCIYHVGSYRHLFHFLARENIDCLLFIAGKTLELQGQSIRDGMNKDWPGTLDMINAEDSASLLKSARALKHGKSVAIYIDGNSGTGGNRDNDRLQPVEFFGKTLRARTGLAYLSHLSGVDIVPVICKRDRDALTLTAHTPISPRDCKDREVYARDVTARLYGVLEREIAATPGQWEGWLYVHKYLKPGQPVNEKPAEPVPATALDTVVAPNLERFAVLDYGSTSILLDKQRHSCSMLDERTADMIRGAVEHPCTIDSVLACPGAQQLLKMGVFRTLDSRPITNTSENLR